MRTRRPGAASRDEAEWVESFDNRLRPWVWTKGVGGRPAVFLAEMMNRSDRETADALARRLEKAACLTWQECARRILYA